MYPDAYAALFGTVGQPDRPGRAESERLGRIKDEFLATLAHELRNPLAPLRSSLEILRQESISPEAREAARMVMLRQVNQMVALIDDLIDISRISTGRIDLHRRHPDLLGQLAQCVLVRRANLAGGQFEVFSNRADERTGQLRTGLFGV